MVGTSSGTGATVGISGYSNLAPSSHLKIGQHPGKGAVLLVFSGKKMQKLSRAVFKKSRDTLTFVEFALGVSQWQGAAVFNEFQESRRLVFRDHASGSSTERLKFPGFAWFYGGAPSASKAHAGKVCGKEKKSFSSKFSFFLHTKLLPQQSN